MQVQDCIWSYWTSWGFFSSLFSLLLASHPSGLQTCRRCSWSCRSTVSCPMECSPLLWRAASQEHPELHPHTAPHWPPARSRAMRSHRPTVLPQLSMGTLSAIPTQPCPGCTGPWGHRAPWYCTGHNNQLLSPHPWLQQQQCGGRGNMALVHHLFLSFLILLMVLYPGTANYVPRKSKEAGKLPAVAQPFMG